MQLTVLGCFGPYPHIDGACSGYLVSSKNAQILIDLGSGSLRNYFRHAKLENLDGIFLSHLHADHISDIGALKYALELNGLHKNLYAPAEPAEEFKRLVYKDIFTIEEIDNDKKVQINDLSVSFCKMQHAIPSYAIKIESEGKTFVYSGDTGYCPQLESFTNNCDFLLCEAGILNSDDNKKHIHMSAYQACETAEKNHIKKLLLTHFYPEYTKESYQKEVENFSGIHVMFAQENKSYDI